METSEDIRRDSFISFDTTEDNRRYNGGHIQRNKSEDTRRKVVAASRKIREYEDIQQQ